VRAIMDAFPGARIDTVHDTTADVYGLPTVDDAPDAEISDEMELDE
jgi:DNA polymerase III subunit gamma/tau